MATPGSRYRVVSIPFSLARERCHDLRCSEGQILACVANAGHVLALECDDGRALFMEREIAWFVRVAPVEATAVASAESDGTDGVQGEPPIGTGRKRGRMKKILVAFDASITAVHALRHVIGLAQEDPDLAIHIVTASRGKRRCREILATGEALLQEAGVSYTKEILAGPVAGAIVRRAEEMGCDGIIMGTRGLTALQGLVGDSTATRVVHASHMPVTLVK
jgi:nucleotide-binding universal stress UspA family protein